MGNFITESSVLLWIQQHNKWWLKRSIIEVNLRVWITHTLQYLQSFSLICCALTNIMARAALRSLRYLSLYFSFWFFRGPLFILVLWSEELVGDGKAGPEAPEPQLEMFCCGEVRKDWAVKAWRACCRSSSVCEWNEKDRGLFICIQSAWGLCSCCLKDEMGNKKTCNVDATLTLR